MVKITKNWREKYSIKSLLGIDKKNTQPTQQQCYCPVCKAELISTNSYVGESEFIRFKCKSCGVESKWIFDTPVPLRLGTEVNNI